jgi:hypothetical protein
MTLHGGHGPMRLIDLDNVLPDPWRVARAEDERHERERQERERRELAARQLADEADDPAMAVRAMICPARVCPGVSAGVSAGVPVGVSPDGVEAPAETPPLGWMTVQVSGEMYLPRGDPTHGINHDHARALGGKARRLVLHAAPIAPLQR